MPRKPDTAPLAAMPVDEVLLAPALDEPAADEAVPPAMLPPASIIYPAQTARYYGQHNEFTGRTLELEADAQGNYAVPWGATLAELPPCEAGEIPIYDAKSDSWSVARDDSGVWYNADGVELHNTNPLAKPDGAVSRSARPSPAHVWVDGDDVRDWVLDKKLQASIEAEAKAATIAENKAAYRQTCDDASRKPYRDADYASLGELQLYATSENPHQDEARQLLADYLAFWQAVEVVEAEHDFETLPSLP